MSWRLRRWCMRLAGNSTTMALTPTLCLVLPVPAKGDNGYYWADAWPQSIGKVRANNGNFGVLVRAYTYIRTYGPDGLLHVAQSAILNANYLKHELASDYEIAYPQICQHEFVATAHH